MCASATSTIGIRGTREVEVLSGLSEGERVASPAATDLKDGARVRVVDTQPVNLIFDIALTHVRARVRQTGFAVAGVATGVGFSIMMASLMQGSQDDFTQRLVNTLPHITVSDERRNPPPQPAERLYAGRRNPRPDAGGAPARHQEPARHHGRARRLAARRHRALGQGAGHHPLRQPRRLDHA